MAKVSDETKRTILELLIAGRTPQEIAGSGQVAASQATVARLARTHGLSAARGPRRGPRRSGASSGRSVSRRTELLGIEAARLRADGKTWREIAKILDLKSAQHAFYLFSVAEKQK